MKASIKLLTMRMRITELTPKMTEKIGINVQINHPNVQTNTTGTVVMVGVM